MSNKKRKTYWIRIKAAECHPYFRFVKNLDVIIFHEIHTMHPTLSTLTHCYACVLKALHTLQYKK